MKNPPAYPNSAYSPPMTTETRTPFEIEIHNGRQGLSLLDHFAGLAMQGMSFSTGHGSGSEEFFQEQIRTAYRVARAMLEERAKPENNINS